MNPSSIAIRTVTDGPDLDHVRALLHQYNAHLRAVVNPALIVHRESELAGLPGNFVPPRGALLLATSEDGRPLGCAALRPISLANELFPIEFCRLWVSPHARGRALGSQLLKAAITLSRSTGHTAMVLNSVAIVMQSAQSTYARAGFVPTPPYKHVPIPGIQFFRLDLASLPPLT